jgi:polar amino acid transport system substrate-binding protein
MKRRILLTGAGLLGAQITLPALAAGTERTATVVKAAKRRETTRSAIGRIRTAGVLKVSVVQQFPWSTIDSTKAWSGFDIDVCNRLAADLDVKAQFLDTAWNGAADDVAQGVSDIAASLQPTPRRLLVVNFSRPYGTSQATLVANRQKAAGLNTLADFNQPNVVIGVRGKSGGERIARELLAKAQIRVVGDDVEALNGLQSGELTAMVALTPLPEILAARAPGYLVQPLAEPLRRRSECFAVRVDDGALLEYLNSWVRYSEESGFLAERRTFWFGGDAKPTE